MTKTTSINPIRALLPFSVLFTCLPFIFPEQLMTFISMPVFFFFGSYFFLLNFPRIGNKLHAKPLYVEDLILEYNNVREHTFRNVYTVLMNFMLASLFAVVSEYLIIRGIHDKPFIEICAIIGGNLSLYLKVQNVTGKLMLKIFYRMKQIEVRKRRESEIELENEPEKKDFRTKKDHQPNVASSA